MSDLGCKPAPLGGCWHLYWMLQGGRRAGVRGKQGQWRDEQCRPGVAHLQPSSGNLQVDS